MESWGIGRCRIVVVEGRQIGYRFVSRTERSCSTHRKDSMLIITAASRKPAHTVGRLATLVTRGRGFLKE